MNPQKRQAVLVAVMLVLLAITVLWSYGRYAEARDRAAAAEENTAAVEALAESIESLRRRPTMGVQALADTQLTAMIETSARAAGFDPETVVLSIRPQPDRRVENTPYRQKTTELRLQHLTLRQLVQFLHDLSSRNPGLRIDGLQLSSPTGEGSTATWTVDPLTLSYLIYAPQGPADRRAASR
jgi:type II secretory pathway component PulM